MTYKLVATGELPSYQIGGVRRVAQEDLDVFLEERKSSMKRIPNPRRQHF